MKLSSHGGTGLSVPRARAERGCVFDSSRPGTERSIPSRTNAAWSGDQHLNAAGVSALIAIEKIIVWTISVLLAAFFLLVGALKLSNPSGIAGGLSRWPNPALLYLLARAVEITGAVTLLIPRWASVGAVGLAAMMAGIVGKHLMRNEPTATIVPIVLLVLLGIVAYAREPEQT